MRIDTMHTDCSFCKKGRMHYDQNHTFLDYSLPETFVLDDIDRVVDGIISQYLVYRCNKCGSVEKFTYKEIERRERKRMSTLVIKSAARGEIETALLRPGDKALVYCGKCNGLDGKGACLAETYRNCKLKRLPNEL